MRVEIKKIGISTVLFSVFPLAVFVVMLLSAFMEIFNPDVTVSMAYIMGLVMRAIQSTLLFLVSTAGGSILAGILLAAARRSGALRAMQARLER